MTKIEIEFTGTGIILYENRVQKLLYLLFCLQSVHKIPTRLAWATMDTCCPTRISHRELSPSLLIMMMMV